MLPNRPDSPRRRRECQFRAGWWDCSHGITERRANQRAESRVGTLLQSGPDPDNDGFLVELPQDDGFVLVGGNNDDGRDGGMVLVKLNADWDREWRKDHPGEIGAGPSTAVTTTDDGGYALSGALQKPYTDEDFAPGIVKTDADGNAGWFQRIDQLVEDSGKSAEGYSITQTDDVSFVVTAEHYDHDHPGAAEVGTPEKGSTPAESPTPTGSPTDTPRGDQDRDVHRLTNRRHDRDVRQRHR